LARERERAEAERARERERRNLRRAAAEQAAAGPDRGAAALAEMLVPNVRPIFIDRPMCDPPSEIDHGGGEPAHDSEWLAGTPYDGRYAEFSGVVRSLGGELPGAACNAEVRNRFAGHLRRRLTARQLREATLFLGAGWFRIDAREPVTRLTAFRTPDRRAPVDWQGGPESGLARWAREDRTGRALQRATDGFWRETGPLLGDADRLCPAATTVWRAAQRALVDDIRVEEARRAAAAAAAEAPAPR
jgi:hypothetical protein